MINSKLIRLLSSLNKNDLIKFGDYVESPYFNKLNSLVQLYKALRKFYPAFRSKELTRENIFKKVFPGEKFDYGRLRSVFSLLLAQAERFLAFQKYSSDDINVRLDITEEITKVNDANLLNKNFSVLNDKLENCEIKDEKYYFQLFRTVSLLNLSSGHFSGEKNIQKETDSLTMYYLISMLKIYRYGLNVRRSLNIDMNFDMADELLKLIEKHQFSTEPAIMIHLNLFELLKYDRDECFFKHLNLIEAYPGVLGSEELYETYVELLNFCVLRVQKGKNEFSNHKFSIYKSMLDKNLFKGFGKYFPYIIFNNIVASALEMKEYKWAEWFIEKYREELDINYKNDMVNLSYARLFFNLRSFEKANGYLSLCGNNENLQYRLAVKDLQIRVLYELGYYESIFSIIDSYRHFFSYNRMLAKPVKENYRLYLKNLEKLIKLRLEGNKEKINILKEKLASAGPFIYKDWLTGKLTEIS